jgi:hypothetical protein
VGIISIGARHWGSLYFDEVSAGISFIFWFLCCKSPRAISLRDRAEIGGSLGWHSNLDIGCSSANEAHHNDYIIRHFSFSDPSLPTPFSSHRRHPKFGYIVPSSLKGMDRTRRTSRFSCFIGDYCCKYSMLELFSLIIHSIAIHRVFCSEELNGE